MATASRYIFQKLGEYLGARPKSKAERYGFKGEPMVDDPAHEQASSEPSHPEDEQLFGAGSREPLPTRGRADDLGRVPIIPPEVLKSGRLDDVVTPLEFLPGLYELKVLVQRLVSLTEGEEDVIAYANHLQTDCLSMLDLMKGFNSTSPPLEKAVTRMREELMKTLVHLECQAKKRHRIRILLQRESIFERLLRCDEARKRIMQEYQILQGNEILHTIRAQNPHADALKERIQAAEEEVQHLLRRETGKNIPREIILQERIKYRQSPAVCVSQRFSVYKGELVSGEAIAIKFSEVKSSLDNDEGRNFGRRILRHASTWASFDSKYILPFLGMGVQIVEQSEEGKRDYYKVYFVSPWMPCGNAVNYIQESHKQRLHVDVTKLVRDIALGLQYLHQQDEPCIHGSVRGENVLIKLERGIEQACLNGFALTKRQVQTEAAPEMTGEDKIHRWKAPEIINATSRNPLMEPPSDIWSWAMTALELYSGKEPYHYHVKDRGVMADITIGKAPIRGEYPTFETYASHPDAIWALFEKCWKMEPKERPTIQEVIRELDTITAMPRASR